MSLTRDAMLWYHKWSNKKQATHKDIHADLSLFGDPLPLAYSCDEFQEDLKICFLSPQYLDRLEDDFYTLKQSGSPIVMFANKVRQLGLQ